MNDRLIAAFDDCLGDVERGSDLEECLRRYPDLAEALRPQLQTLLQTKALVSAIQPPPGSPAASRAQFLLQAEKMLSDRQAQARSSKRRTTISHQRQQPAPGAGFLARLLHPLTYRAAGVFAILAVALLAGTGVLNVSAQSLPGTPLYVIKRLVENTQLALSPSTESRARLEGTFGERHSQEARQVTARGWNVPLEFGGLLDKQDGERWSVAGITVIVPVGAEVKGSPEIGLYVDVHGTAQPDRTVLATQVTVEGMLFQGRVDQIETGVWRVEGRTLFIGDDTTLEDHLVPGDLVEVRARQLSDGSLLAENIRLVTPGPAEPDSGPKGDPADDGSRKIESTQQPGSDDSGGQTPEPTHLPGGDDNGGRTAEPTHLPGGDDNSGKAPEPTHLPGSDGNGGQTPEPAHTSSPKDGGGLLPTETPQSGGSGKPVEPSRTPEPPTHTPNSGGSTSQKVKFQGVLQSVSGNTWVVAGQAVQIDAGTAIENSPKAGDNVEVEANVQPDGSLLATRIRVKN